MLSAAPLLAGGAASAATNDFNGGAVTNCSLAPATKTYTCGALSLPDFNSSTAIASGYTVIVSSALAFGFNQGLQMSGSARLQASDLDIGDIKPALLNITGGTLAADNTFTIGDQAQTIVANVTAPTINVGSGSSTQITGTLTATNQIVLASNVTVIGNLDAPTVRLKASSTSVKGNINASTALTIESGNTVNGNITGGALTMDSAGVVVNGNVTMTGDVSIGASGTINGDLKARNVVTHASGDYISGNAAVNAIYLDFGATVGKTITCNGSGASGCSCVTRADSKYNPTCGAPPPSLADHIRISHSGNALTCLPQTVTLTACANSACTAPHYSGDIAVTLQPGGATFTISGGTNNAAAVSQISAGTATLSATSAGASGASTCVNSGDSDPTHQCNMVFADNGLVMAPPDHVAMTTASFTIQALKSAPAPNAGKSCVPLLTGATSINFKCDYKNPANAADVPLQLKDGNNSGALYTNAACHGSSTPVPLVFDNTGAAAVKLQYAEVGTVNLTAAYASGGLGASGSAMFTAAPKSFEVIAVRQGGPYKQPTPAPAPPVFARASEPLTVTVSAFNAAGKVTTNFGQEKPTAQNVTISSLVTIPDKGVGTLTGSFGPFTAGVATGTWAFNDVGTVKLTAKLTNPTGYYMDNQSTGFNATGEQTIGRFIPDHFDTMLPDVVASAAVAPTSDQLPYGQITGVPMDCNKASALQNPCQQPLPASGKFIYSAEPFYIVVKAYNGDTPPGITKNYADKAVAADSLAKTITLSSWTAAGGLVAVPASVGGMSWNVATAKRFSFTDGVGTVAANLPYFAFSAAPSNPTAFYIRATDTDAVSSQRTGAVEPVLTAASGKLYLPNNSGSLTAPLPLNLQAQYYNGKGYVLNGAYQSDPVALGGFITYEHCQNSLDSSADKKGWLCAAGFSLQLIDTTIKFIDGKAAFRVRPPTPTPASNGSVDVTLQTPSTATPANAPLIPWLPSTTGRQTFGVYRSGPVIYTREVHN